MVQGFLRLEGLALLMAATIAYHALDGSWWFYALLFFAPDVAFLGYLAGPRFGAVCYNLLHSTIGPLLLAVAAWWLGGGIPQGVMMLVAAIWIAHVGFDRMLGYGLKFTSGFKDTHLGRL